ncbi:hypothetical protein G5714_013114 [Onychostoma macrolepis]|uniref:Uncharacterized protein n=1 Tax=Onychostoma macrolepis TaxID=369639 RepID=A0A7J6CIA3_9TELE|nr:hypothetical protein G5714_013114 [Onychostoma macrolepis]
MVGCFAVGGASVEAYIRMLGCTVTIEPASQMNWAVEDQKISMKKKTHLETPGSKMCMMPNNNKGKLRKRRPAVTVQKWLGCGPERLVGIALWWKALSSSDYLFNEE